MLLWWFGGLALLGLLLLVTFWAVRRHKGQDCAVVLLGASLSRQRLEGALRQLARQRESFRRVYLWDEAPAPWRQQMLGLLGPELGFYLLTEAELARLQERQDCRLLYLDTFGRLHKSSKSINLK